MSRGLEVQMPDVQTLQHRRGARVSCREALAAIANDISRAKLQRNPIEWRT